MLGMIFIVFVIIASREAISWAKRNDWYLDDEAEL